MLISLDRAPKAVTADRCHSFNKIRVAPPKPPVGHGTPVSRPPSHCLPTHHACMFTIIHRRESSTHPVSRITEAANIYKMPPRSRLTIIYYHSTCTVNVVSPVWHPKQYPRLGPNTTKRPCLQPMASFSIWYGSFSKTLRSYLLTTSYRTEP